MALDLDQTLAASSEASEATLPPAARTGAEATLGATLAVAASGDPRPRGRASAAVGAKIGRHVILSKLGAGAMGVVLAAYDPELDRKVAIKLLKGLGGEGDSGRARLQREAQALAKLNHRNVVAVHDVGVHDGQLFVSMEFVEGQTLGAWMAELDEPRPWREVLAVFGAAGRGLAAAHEAGLVHRDFKPDNVMLGDDGEVRVMDFGLARAALDDSEGGETSQASEGPALDSHALLDSNLTQTGTVLGTPAYMAREQFEGRPADARSDLFAFCVALYEALYGERPYGGQTLGELCYAVQHDKLRPAPKRTTVPGWLRAIVVRGLASDPDQRWPSMQALLDALDHDPGQQRRRWAAAGVVAALLGGLGWGVAGAVAADAQTCADLDARLEGVWDEGRRAELAAAFEASELRYAATSLARVETKLDAYAEQWVAARVEACEATHRGEQSGALLDLRMACLDERLGHVAAAVEVLAQADASVVERAVDVVSGLPSLDRCADLEALRAAIPPPDDADAARRVAELDDELARAAALQKAGKYSEALALAREVAGAAEALDYEPLEVRAGHRQGSLEEEIGEYEQAEATLERALGSALALGMKTEAAAVSTELVYVVGVQLARFDEGRYWAKLAEPLARAAGTDEARGEFLHNLGVVEAEAGEYDQARRYHEQALALDEASFGPHDPSVATSLASLARVAKEQANYEQARGYLERALEIAKAALGDEHPDVAIALHNLANTERNLGELDAARRHHEQALALFERLLGPEHPHVASSLTSLGNVAADQHDYDEARRHHQRALDIAIATFGPEHPQVAGALGNLGIAAENSGDWVEARGYYERALAIKQATLGSEHPSVGGSHGNLGLVLAKLGEHEQARDHHQRALDIFAAALGPDNRYVGQCAHNLAGTLRSLGQLDEAQASLDRALAIYEAALGPDDPAVASVLTSLASLARVQGRTAHALALLDRALAIYEGDAGEGEDAEHSTDLADARFELAQTLWAAGEGEGRERAAKLGDLAEAAYVEAGPRAKLELDALRAWKRAR